MQVRHKLKQFLLVICLFLFLLVVVGGGLHLNPTGALLAAATGTPLIVHVFNRWSRRPGIQDSHTASESSRRTLMAGMNESCTLESKDIVRQ